MPETNEHRKYYNGNTEIPSCTTIVSLLGKPELVKWANYMGFKHVNTTSLLEEKAKYGTYCHKQFECYFTDGLMCANSNTEVLTKAEYREIVYKFKIVDLYFKKLGIEVLANELAIEGETYGGTLDMICYNRTTDSLMIFDLKTSKQLYQSHWIQLMGYVQLVEEKYGLPVSEVGIILLSKPLKSPELINIRRTKECWREKEIFNKLRDVYYFLNASEEMIDEKLKIEREEIDL